jgi:hypothetical protein
MTIKICPEMEGCDDSVLKVVSKPRQRRASLRLDSKAMRNPIRRRLKSYGGTGEKYFGG